MSCNDLTVVLTLKDRSRFTYRWMRWMEEQKFPYKILIADGGSDKEIEKHLCNKRNYPSLDYQYIRYPYDSGVAQFVGKVADAASRVTTRFVIAADNDDFILLEPLERNLSLLRERDDIHTLCPVHFRFRIHKHAESVDDLVDAGNARVTLTRVQHVGNPALEQRNPVTRLVEVVENFYSALIYYGIHRSDEYSRINQRLQEMAVQRFLFIEWYTIYSYAVAGKVVLSSTEPFLLRQEDTSQGASSTYSVENHANISLLRDWSAQLYGLIDDLYLQCLRAGGILDRAEFEDCFRSAFRKHMLSFVEFRGLAERLRRFPRLFAWGRRLFALYRGQKALIISRGQVRRNNSLRRALHFLGEYRCPQRSETENAHDSAHAAQ